MWWGRSGGRRDADHEWPWFACALAVAFATFWCGVRVAVVCPVGPVVGEVGTRLGALLNATDNLSYAAWAQQGRQGLLAMRSLYTVAPHEALFINPYFALIGIMARVSGLHVLAIMNVVGLLSAVIAIVAIYKIAIALQFDRLAARWATVFFAFGSGLSMCFDSLGVSGVDVTYMDAVAHSTFMVYPYHSAALALLAVAVLSILRACDVSERGGDSRVPRLKAAALVLLLTWVHPYELWLPLAGMGVWCLGRLLVESTAATRATAATFGALLLAATPATVHAYAMLDVPVWSSFSSRSLGHPVASVAWLVGYGMPLAFACVGAWTVAFGSATRGTAGWILTWFVGLCVLLIGFEVPQSKLCNGGPIPLCLLAGLGFSHGWSLADRIAARRSKGAAPWRYRTIVVVLTASAFTTPLGMLPRYGVAVPQVDSQVTSLLGDPATSAPRAWTVLCDNQLGELLPGLYGYRVYAGHWSLTPGFQTRVAELRLAGIFPKGMTGMTAADAEANFHRLLTARPWDLVVLANDTPASAFAHREPTLRPIATTPGWTLFRLAS